jgi:uncharacterized protein (TIGR03000 family)
MQRLLMPAVLALAAAAGAALAQSGTQSGTPATIVVRVPYDATVVVGSQETTQRGSQRRFVTPDLVPGYTYSYQLEARWIEGGKEVSAKRTVSFRPGDTAIVDFLRQEVAAMPKAESKTTKELKTEVKKPAVKVTKKVEAKKSVVTKVGDSKADADGFVNLFNGKDLSGWSVVPENAKGAFSVTDGVIVVSGKPNGYFHTDKSYKNYVLRYDWKFIKDGNSGLLVHITGDHKVWPKSVEVQGYQKDHGNIFAIGGAKGSFKKDAEAQKKAIKPVGEWNLYEIISKDGELTVKLNGTQVATGKGDLVEGPLGWQSEGAEIHFKNIKIKEAK